jgi:hypothetical protein
LIDGKRLELPHFTPTTKKRPLNSEIDKRKGVKASVCNTFPEIF